MRLRIFFKTPGVLFCALILTAFQARARDNLDRELKPSVKAGEDLEVFKDMVVVQRKAMKKSDRFLVSSYAALDFSDGPYSMYGFHLNPGYALSDFWEVYLNFAPLFISNPRSIVAKLEDKGFTLVASKAKLEYGAEILWSPLYGKDSLGSTRLIRSDTFAKFGISNLQYDEGSGLKIHFALGKTYFINRFLGFRPAISGNFIQTGCL